MDTTLQLTAIELRVADLARSLKFYVEQLGFAAVSQAPGRAELAVTTAAPAILTLREDRAAPAAPSNAAGLFHAALLFPSRAALGGWLRRAAELGVEFDGFADHGVSEATYFSDPDGNGLEFYVDRSREAWPAGTRPGEVAMFTRPLAVQSLLADGRPSAGSPLAGTQWGHLHLRVTQLDRSERFYCNALGMSLTQGTFPGARFLAADGYHHHLGLNSWGDPRQPQPAGALGLIAATFTRPGWSDGRSLRDPDGMALHITGS